MNDTTRVATREQQAAPEKKAVAALIPPVNVIEDEGGITVTADLPGVSRDRLDVKVNGDTLVIEGEASVAVPRDLDLLYAEMRAPQFRRTFTLSRELDASKIDANLKDGVLKLRIPKVEQARPRRIEVKVG